MYEDKPTGETVSQVFGKVVKMLDDYNEAVQAYLAVESYLEGRVTHAQLEEVAKQLDTYTDNIESNELKAAIIAASRERIYTQIMGVSSFVTSVSK